MIFKSKGQQSRISVNSNQPPYQGEKKEKRFNNINNQYNEFMSIFSTHTFQSNFLKILVIFSDQLSTTHEELHVPILPVILYSFILIQLSKKRKVTPSD